MDRKEASGAATNLGGQCGGALDERRLEGRRTGTEAQGGIFWRLSDAPSVCFISGMNVDDQRKSSSLGLGLCEKMRDRVVSVLNNMHKPVCF